MGCFGKFEDVSHTLKLSEGQRARRKCFMPLPLTQLQIREPHEKIQELKTLKQGRPAILMPLKFRTKRQQMNESRDQGINGWSWRATVFDKLLRFSKALWVVLAPSLSHANPQCHLWCFRWQVLSSGRVFHRKSSWHLPCSHPFLQTLDSVRILMDFYPQRSFPDVCSILSHLPFFFTFCSSSYSGTSWAVKYRISMRNSMTPECWAIWHIDAYCTLLRQRHENHRIMI